MTKPAKMEVKELIEYTGEDETDSVEGEGERQATVHDVKYTHTGNNGI